MGLTTLFIRRHVATVLLTLALCVAGVISYTMLPVAPLPNVDFPTINIRARLPGASPITMATSVATPLERSLGTIAGITEMTSASMQGMTTITVQFDLSRDINGASRDVQAAINAAMSNLPSNMPNTPTYRQMNPANAPIMLLALTSESVRREQLYDLASTVLAQKISQVEGVGEVVVGGGSFPAIRAVVNSDLLHKNGVALSQVTDAIRSFNVHQPQGAVEYGNKHWQIAVNDQAETVEEYQDLVITTKDNTAMRLGDIAEITNGVQDIRNMGLMNGKPSVVLVVFRQPGANIIEAVDAVKATLPQLQASIPTAVDMQTVFDTTTTIRASLKDVMMTLYLSVALVIVVVYLFLGELRATLIPGIAITASLVGTFVGMYLLDYSLDNLSLMALAIATGFVVDDAIVVLENISRHIEKGLKPLDAAIAGAKEVSFTVLSITLSLIAVFIPILFMGGMVGRLFREFAVTLSLAIGVSLVLSLTLTPMLCAYVLNRQVSPEDAGHYKPGSIKARLDAWHLAMQMAYSKSLEWVLKHQRLTLLLWFVTVGLTVFMYVTIPKGFFPEQDTGLIRGSLQADEVISYQELRVKLRHLMEMVQQDPAVENVIGYTGSTATTGFVAVSLKPRSQRDASAQQVVNRLRAKMSKEPGARLFLMPMQDINVGGRQSRSMYQYTLQSDNIVELNRWTSRLQRALAKHPIFKDLNNDLESGGGQANVVIDRDTASRLGVSVSAIDNALNNAFGQAQASMIYKDRNQYWVVMTAEDVYWQGPSGLDSVYVPAADGTLVPLMALAKMEPGKTPVRVNHQGQSAAATISFNLAPGASLSEATEAIAQARAKIGMPPTISATFQGTAKEFVRALQNQVFLILAAIVCLYIVLGVLYESYIHPVTILSTLPPAGIGALLALRAFNMDFSVIALIGVLLLAGIVKKNAILLIDFAIEAERHEKLTPEESITKACALRFRPIMMTTMAALFGAIPLAIGFGDGAELRRPLGISIIGGLILSQAMTLYTTPVLYLYLDRLSLWWKRRKSAMMGRFSRTNGTKEVQ